MKVADARSGALLAAKLIGLIPRPGVHPLFNLPCVRPRDSWEQRWVPHSHLRRACSLGDVALMILRGVVGHLKRRGRASSAGEPRRCIWVRPLNVSMEREALGGAHYKDQAKRKLGGHETSQPGRSVGGRWLSEGLPERGRGTDRKVLVRQAEGPGLHRGGHREPGTTPPWLTGHLLLG